MFRKRVATGRGTLTFTSVTTLDERKHRLIVSERHSLQHEQVKRSSEYEFLMQCWTRDELDAALGRAQFDDVQYFGAYDPDVKAGATDRLVGVAQLPTT